MAELNHQPKIAFLILAAGESKRMGTPKQLLKWGNSTLLNHSIEQASNANASGVFVVLGANYLAIEKSILNQNITIIKYANWNLGMGSTLAFGIQKIQHHEFDGVLLLLADQPQVDSSFLNQLISEFEKGEKSIIATAYKKGDGVPAIFDKSYLGQLIKLSGKRGAMQMINKNSSNVKTVDSEKPIYDIDTVEDYEEFYNLHFNSP